MTTPRLVRTALPVLFFFWPILVADADKPKPAKKEKAAPVKHEGRNVAVCAKASAPVKIDGDLDDWKDVDVSRPVVIGEADCVHKASAHYQGPSDACAAVFLKWDDANLYLAAVVTDDVVRNTHQGGSGLQNGDGILLCLTSSIPPKDAPDKVKYDYCYILTPGDFKKVKPQLQLVQGVGGTQAQMAARRTRHGYRLEVALPLEYLPKLKPAPGKVVGLEVCQYEGDERFLDTNRTEILAWNSKKDRMDARECGELTFTAEHAGTDETPSDVDPAMLVRNPYKPKAIYAAREIKRSFERYGAPLKLYFDRTERKSLLEKTSREVPARIFRVMKGLCESYIVTWRPEMYSCKNLEPSQAAQVSKVLSRSALLYALTEDAVYAEIARRTLLSLADKIDNWCSSLEGDDSLSVAVTLSHALLVGYDWASNTLTDDERKKTMAAIRTAGERISAALDGGDLPAEQVDPARCLLGEIALATKKDNKKADDWIEAAVKSAVRCASKDWGRNAEEKEAGLMRFLLFAEPLRRLTGRDLYLECDVESAYAELLKARRTKVKDGWAMDFFGIGPGARASVALKVAAQCGSREAMWFYEKCFEQFPAGCGGADDVYAFIWFPRSARSSPPDWYSRQSQASFPSETEEKVRASFLKEAAEREKARKKLRPIVAEQRKLPVPFSAEFVGHVDESIIERFHVTIKPDLLKQHPRLYFTGDDIPMLRARLATTHRAFYRSMLEELQSRLNSPYRSLQSHREAGRGPTGRSTGDAVGRFGLAYGLTGRDDHAELAKRWAMGLAEEFPWDTPYPDLVQGHALAGLGIAYDCLYHYLMPEERRLVKDALVKQSTIMAFGYRHLLKEKEGAERKKLEEELKAMHCDTRRSGTVSRPRRIASANNHSWVQKTGLAIAAAAVYDETPLAKDWMDRVRWEYQKILEIHGPDGASCEGGGMYWSYGLTFMLRYLELLYHVSGESLYGFDWLRNTGIYSLYIMAPDRVQVINFGDNPTYVGRIGDIHYRLASEFRDGHVQWRADTITWNAGVRGGLGLRFWNCLWYDPTVPVTPPDDLPPYRYFDDLEMATMRSDWSEQAMMVAFRCGPPMGYSVFKHGASGYGHSHPDQGHFSIVADGKFLLWDPGYSRFKMTREHNTILVDGRGQFGEEQIWFHKKVPEERLARIEEFFGTPGYCYVRGDVHRAYFEDLGLKKFMRHLMFVDGRYLVTFDEIQTDADRKIDWLLHSENPFKPVGRWQFETVNEPMALAVKVVEPNTFTHTMEPLLVRFGVKWLPDGRHEYVKEGTPRGYILALSPPEKLRKVNFLAFYYPFKVGAEAKVPPVQRLEGENVLGLAAGTEKERDIIAFNLGRGEIEIEEVKTDALRFMLRTAGERVVKWVLHDGRHLAYRDMTIARSSVRARIVFQGDSLLVDTPRACALKIRVEEPAGVAVKDRELKSAYDADSKLLGFSLPAGRTEVRIVR